MYRCCTTEKTAGQQRLLSDTLLRTMALRRYDDISVTQLCGEAGLSRKIFYRLFDSKDDVLCILVDQALADYARTCAPASAAPGSLAEQVRQFLLYWQDHRGLLDVLYRSGKLVVLPQRMMEGALANPADTCRWLGLEPWPDCADELVFLISGMMGVLTCWCAEGCVRPVEQIAGRVEELLLEPLWTRLAAEKGRGM